ncbi:NAD(P)H-dependent oxidoreductase [Algiphilus sp. W345]|uniref:NAD(P)H-dependent oxidoreductase n=1 Tax=Banduia mediterranea TaxID=3075609 RepID=A0ABU2WI14_9GAMM|nr:NAD(P)H-dependent oxidoreductase [Algiphilus sp. W345]MDT0497520.1 NAD(P)H-dependent oxidoreductase [Algiphilus sp. W345]
MSSRRITIIQGHPDIEESHLGHALASAYADGAAQAGHQLRYVIVAQLECPVLQCKEDWEHGPAPEAIVAAQQAIAWADHLLIVFPLWLGTMPASFQAFLEQLLRPGFAFDPQARGRPNLLAGRSAHLVVTMGRPVPVRWRLFGADGVRGLVRNVLRYFGVSPVRTSYLDTGGKAGPRGVRRCLERMRRAGAKAA